MTSAVIVWFRLDLRINDNAALHAARETGKPVIPVYIWSPDEEGKWQPGSASRFWLHHALASLQKDLETVHSILTLMRGPSLEALQSLINETGADSVFWNRCYEPQVIKRDSRITQALKKSGIEVRSFNASLLFEPHEISNRQGGPFKVYTPFWKHYQTLEVLPPHKDTKAKLQQPAKWPKSLALQENGLVPRSQWYTTIQDTWDMSEAGARKCTRHFIKHSLHNYSRDRDYPALDGVSGMSPYLHFGQVSVRQIWHRVTEAEQSAGRMSPGRNAQAYLRQLVWREFAYHLLFHFPHSANQPLYEKYRQFPWRKDQKLLRSWQKGETGYPIVDAGMRQLWQTGWMHNRVRMITGSFLTKDILVSWLEGAKWFWDTLVDADLANNTMGWQWVAGSGADAAPWFRIFNPVTQSIRFDPAGDYIRQWLPELKNLDRKYVHSPWTAPEEVLTGAGIKLGITYPRPVLDHAEARKRALESYRLLREAT